MRITLHHRSREFRPHGIAAKLSTCNEKLLLRREVVGGRNLRLAALRNLKRSIGDLHPGEIPEALAEHELAVMMNARLDEVIVELPHHALGASLKLFQIVSGPPVGQAALRVVLRPLIVEAMADFVANDYANGAVVDRVVDIHAERRRLMNSGWKHDFVEQRIVVRV